ncbi:MAG: DUF421 domain-containing protein [Clostridiales bacterium]|nr:DUF421 domain-containing protein [Clostridiales bacterium]
MGYLQIASETVVTFFVLLLFTRLLGKKQLSHLTYFNYITGITIGSICANMIVLDRDTYIEGIISLAIWCALTSLIGFIGLRSGKARVVLDGEPTILVKKGIIDKRALSSTRVNLDDLSMMLRQKGVFSIKEIDYAILEPNGAVSILKKPKYQTTQKSDFDLTPPEINYIPAEIITDGTLIEENLRELGLSRQWLNTELMNSGINTISEVFYAEVQSDGSLYIQKSDKL